MVTSNPRAYNNVKEEICKEWNDLCRFSDRIISSHLQVCDRNVLKGGVVYAIQGMGVANSSVSKRNHNDAVKDFRTVYFGRVKRGFF